MNDVTTQRTSLAVRASDAEREQTVELLQRNFADGRLTPHIGLVLDWTRTPEVFERMAARAFRGKAVLTVSG